jgi:hypothetical protein
MLTWQTFGTKTRGVLVTGILALCAGGCGDQNAVRVELQARPPSGPPVRRLDIRAQVTGNQAGLRYKWLAAAGECDPQETDWPATIFRFADGAKRDRVSLEVWRENRRIGQSDLDVKLDREPLPLTPAPGKQERLPLIQIAITNIPPYEPAGGPDTRGEIAGTVNGELTPDCKVIIYARASDLWFIQPSAYAALSIHPDQSWSSWTHTGSSYAALVVRPGFDPLLRLDVLPPVGGYVLARTNVLGLQKQE